MKAIFKCLIAGGIIAAIGVAMLIIVISVNGGIDTHFDMLTYTATGENTSLNIDIGAGKVKAQYYDGDKIVIEYPSSKVLNTDISERNGKFSYKSRTKWFVFGNFNYPEAVIKLPEGVKFDVSIEVGAGSATLDAGVYGNVKIDIGAGKINCAGIECETLDCEVSAGSVNIDNAVCKTIDCDVSSGKIQISRLTCNTADIDVSAGSAQLGFTGSKNEYGINVKVSAGSCNVNSQTGTTDKKIIVDVSAGSVNLSFGV